MTQTKKLHYFAYTIGFLDLLGVSMILPLFMIQVRSLGASSILNGFIGSIYGGLQLFSSPLMGSLSDKRGRKCILLWCLFGTALNYILLGSSRSLWIVAISRVCAGIFKHSQTLCRAYLSEITSSENQASVFGKFNAFSSLGFIVGPIIGGHVAGLEQGFFWICSFGAGCFLLNYLIAFIFLEDVSPIKPPPKDEDGNVLQAFDSVKSIDWHDHWDYMSSRFLLSFAVIIFRSNFTLMVHDKFGFTTDKIGYVTSFQAAISTSTSFVTGAITRHFRSTIVLLHYTATLQTLALVLLTFSPHYLLFLGSLVILNISNAIARVTMSKLMLERADKDIAGVLVGVGQSVTSLSRMMAPFFAGAVQEISMYGPGLAGSFSSMLGIIVLSLPLRKTKLKSS